MMNMFRDESQMAKPDMNSEQPTKIDEIPDIISAPSHVFSLIVEEVLTHAEVFKAQISSLFC